MVYLAASDIAMCLVAPVLMYEVAEGTIIEIGPH